MSTLVSSENQQVQKGPHPENKGDSKQESDHFLEILEVSEILEIIDLGRFPRH